jgi:hypothetical protein
VVGHDSDGVVAEDLAPAAEGLVALLAWSDYVPRDELMWNGLQRGVSEAAFAA